MICGRRGGKSAIIGTIAAYVAVFLAPAWRRHVRPGEQLTVLVVATTRQQARIVLRYVASMITDAPELKPLIQTVSDEVIELKTGVSIEIASASFRSIRGKTVAAALIDEAAFLRGEESALPDDELLTAIRPAMSTIPRSLLLISSSPYAKRGIVWDAFKESYGRDDAPALVWRAGTRTMNPTVSQDFIDSEFARDPARAAAEFEAEFRSDIAAFVGRELVEARTMPGRTVLPPLPDRRLVYHAFVDPSGGSVDSMCLAIAHSEDRDDEHRVSVLDLVHEVRPPFSPESVVAEFAAILRGYNVVNVVGDRYGSLWVMEQFHKAGVRYTASERSKSELYLECLPMLTAGQCELLDVPRLAAQLCGLERRTSRAGRDSVDHGPGQHDDVANVACGALVLAGGDGAADTWRQLGSGHALSTFFTSLYPS